MNYTNLWNQFAAALFQQVKNQLDRASYDKTFKARIESRLSEGRWEILYKGKTYTAACSSALTPGQIVRVCAPQNNWDDLFIIMP